MYIIVFLNLVTNASRGRCCVASLFVCYCLCRAIIYISIYMVRAAAAQQRQHNFERDHRAD